MQIDLQAIISLAQQGGEIALQHYQHTTARRKADRSVVTAADEQIEQLIVNNLSAAYPTIGIIGEEQTRQNLNNEYVWAIDPIDGTAAFIAGLPIWGISIGLLHNGLPYQGVFYIPVTKELYWSEPGKGAFYNGTQIHLQADHPADSEDWITIPSNTHRRYHVSFPGKCRSFGSSVADLCYVARGSSIGAFVTRCAIWDLAAGIAILEAAGGTYTGLSGKQPDLPYMARTGAILEEPLVAASPTYIEQLRSQISVRA